MAMKKHLSTDGSATVSIRTYDKDGFRRRAACVCVKDYSELEVLLISRTKQIDQWIFPGGGIEPNEDPLDAACREVMEEAGVSGEILRCLGLFETESTRTHVFVLRVIEELSEWDDSKRCGRKRMWVSVDEARDVLGESHAQLPYLLNLKETATATGIVAANGEHPLKIDGELSSDCIGGCDPNKTTSNSALTSTAEIEEASTCILGQSTIQTPLATTLVDSTFLQDADLTDTCFDGRTLSMNGNVDSLKKSTHSSH